MARPTLAIDLEIDTDCTTVTLSDTTADYGAGTVTINSVTSLLVILRNETNGTYLTYTFTVASGVITAATLSLSGGTPVVITGYLTSTAWPFIADVNEFNFFGAYGITLPDFTDGIYQGEYTITGSGFSYATSEEILNDCTVCCCVANMGAAINVDCDCSDKKLNLFIQASTFLQVARDAAECGNTDKAVNALNKASEICGCNC